MLPVGRDFLRIGAVEEPGGMCWCSGDGKSGCNLVFDAALRYNSSNLGSVSGVLVRIYEMRGRLEWSVMRSLR